MLYESAEFECLGSACGSDMPTIEKSVQTSPNPNPVRILDWVVAVALGIYTELLTEILRQFGLEMRGPMVHWDVAAVFGVALLTGMIIVPVYLLSKTSEKLIDRRAERVIFIIALLVTAFFMPSLSWFAKLASHP
jgi:hypothetical protein